MNKSVANKSASSKAKAQGSTFNRSALYATFQVKLPNFKPRAILILGLLTMCLLVLLVRAIDLQIVQHDKLLSLSQNQSQRVLVVKGQRGSIYDSLGKTLAASMRSPSFYAHPQLIEDATATSAYLAPLLGLPQSELKKKLNSERSFVWLKRQDKSITSATAQSIAKMPGLGIIWEWSRFYPQQNQQSNLLGFTGMDANGLEGLEYAYNTQLSGAEIKELIFFDNLGRDYQNRWDALRTGNSLQLTIHSGIQHIVETAIKNAAKKWQAKSAKALVMNSQSGELLAMAQYPNYNPNHFADYDPKLFLNQAIIGGYEPGSTFKAITMAIALDLGAISTEDQFDCQQGALEYYDSIIHDTAPHGILKPEEILKVSSNICMSLIAENISSNEFYSYINLFGFGQRLGIFTDNTGKVLAGEAKGYVLAPEKWTAIDQAAMSFGHGLLVSPLQLITAINSIATGGKLMKPIIVKRIINSAGEVVFDNQPQMLLRTIKSTTAHTITKFMTSVVSEQGSGKNAMLKNFAVAGKTGTTEKYDIQAHGYSDTKLISSFVGFVPADDPAITVLVIVEEPEKGRYGGIVAAPVFKQIVTETLPILGVWPKE